MSERTTTTLDFEAIFDLCSSITSSIELKEVVAATLSAVRDLLPCDQVVITLVEEGSIKVLAAEPPVSLDIMASGLDVGQGLVGRAVAQCLPIYSPDVSVDARTEETRDRWSTDDRSVVAVPAALGGEVIGALHAISRRVDAFSEQHRARLLAVAPAVAVALRNALAFERERESWEHRRELDAQKAVFLRSAAGGLEQPLADIADLVARVKGLPADETHEVAAELLAKAQQLAVAIEDILKLSLRDSAEITLPKDESESRGGG